MASSNSRSSGESTRAKASTDQPVERRLVVHVGMPRAGSSTLQEVLFHYRQKLEQHGLLYPAQSAALAGPATNSQLYNHKLLLKSAKAYWPPGRFAALHQDIAGQMAASAAPCILLSCEGWWGPGSIRALARTVGYFEQQGGRLEPSIVAVVREPASFLTSLYKLDVLHGRVDVSLEDFWPTKISDSRLRFGSIARRLKDHFGSVTMLDFDTLSDGDRFVGSFLSAVGLDGVLSDAGLKALEHHRSAGNAQFADSRVSMVLFAVRQLGRRAFRSRRNAVLDLISRLAARADLAEELGKLSIQLAPGSVNAIVAATRSETEDLANATALRLADGRQTMIAGQGQTMIAGHSPLGLLMRDELSRLA